MKPCVVFLFQLLRYILPTEEMSQNYVGSANLAHIFLKPAKKFENPFIHVKNS